MLERSKSTWPFIQILSAPVKSPRGDHDLEGHPLSDGNGYRRGVSPPAGFSVVRPIRRSQTVGTPGEVHRHAGTVEPEHPYRSVLSSSAVRHDLPMVVPAACAER